VLHDEEEVAHVEQEAQVE
jgi:hypothetical protein